MEPLNHRRRKQKQGQTLNTAKFENQFAVVTG